MSCLYLVLVLFSTKTNVCLELRLSHLFCSESKVTGDYNKNTNSNDDDPSPFTGSVVSVGAVWASGLVGAHCCPLWPVSPLTHSWHPLPSQHQAAHTSQAGLGGRHSQPPPNSPNTLHSFNPTDIKGGIFHHGWRRWQHWDTDNGHLQCNVHYVEA